MRPVNLKFKGIGSYFGENEVDFSALDSIFLICGETGSGKTTILDAMTLALYDESSGGERTELLNSHYRKENGSAYSVFTFELGEKLYRFSRTYTPKPRAAGFESSQNCEYFSDGKWLPFFDNPTKSAVNGKAVSLLGLTAAQFRQVVILPQGKFEKLLTSSSEEKEAILRTLFGAEKFTRITEALRTAALDEKRQLERERDILRVTLEASGFAAEQEALDYTEKARREINEMKKELAAAQADKKAAADAASEGAVLTELFDRLEKAESEYKRLMEIKNEYDLLKIRTDRLSREKNAMHDFSLYTSAEDEMNKRTSAAELAQAVLSEAAKKHEAALAEEKMHREKSAENEKIKAELVRLEGLREVYEKAEPMKKAAENAEKTAAELRQSLDAAQSAVKQTETVIEEKNAEMEHIRVNFTERLIPLYERMKELEDASKSKSQLDKTEKDITSAEKELDEINSELNKANEAEASARTAYEEGRISFVHGISARLARELTEGIPCPVCGSTHHPVLCTEDGNIPSEAELDALSAELEAASERRSSLSAEAQRLSLIIEELTEKAEQLRSELRDKEYSDETYTKASDEYAAAKEKNAQLSEISEAVRTLTEKKKALEAEYSSLSERYSEAEAGRIKALQEYNTACERMDKAIPDTHALTRQMDILKKNSDDYEKRLSALAEKSLESAKSLSAARNASDNAAAELADASEKYAAAGIKAADALLKNGLPPIEEYIPDKDGIAELDSLCEKYSAYEQAVKSAEQNRADAMADTNGRTRPDIQSLEAALAQADKRLADIDFRIRSGEEKISQIEKIIEKYAKHSAELAVREEASARRTEFAEEMNGARGISFTRYVLGVMLDMVIDEANFILSGMLGGTFRLIRQQKMKANKKQGLDLLVENTIAGSSASYAAAQLSGGEKFIISLALGVALSTVVQSRFGGVSIDAMFIDEGFGSLDPASLKDAVGMIFGISGSRRTIGIISHVEKLKEEIPSFLNVRKNASGSSVEVSV